MQGLASGFGRSTASGRVLEPEKARNKATAFQESFLRTVHACTAVFVHGCQRPELLVGFVIGCHLKGLGRDEKKRQ